jgi:formate dehydrogenase subunit gamma
MTHPHGTLTRNTTGTRINHWITGGCFVLLVLSGLSMFDPITSFLSGLFGGGQSTRAIHPWIGVVLLISYLGLIIQFWRDNLWKREDLAWLAAAHCGWRIRKKASLRSLASMPASAPRRLPGSHAFLWLG